MGTYLDEAFERLRAELDKPTAPNELFVRYGTAVRTLDTFREEQNLKLPNPVETDLDKCIALIRQIRNSFAHNTIEPQWKVSARYRLLYNFDDVRISLEDITKREFSFDDVSGPETLFALRAALESRI